MSAASVIRACDLLPTDSGSYTTPGTGRNTPPPGNISANVGQCLPSQVSDFNKPSPSTINASTSTDSGYASFVSTPEKGTLAQKLFKRTPKRLSIFVKDVPDLVNNRFHDLCVLFNEPLYRYLGRHGVTATAMSIKLKYAGESEATAKPWIIVQCDERALRRVRRFFNQQQIKAQYQPRDAESPDVDFGLLVHGTPPKQMATKSKHYICGDTWDGAPTLCGKVIKICTSNETRLATLGGLIKVVRSEGIQLYGMTAGHIVTRKEFEQDVVDDGDDTNEKQSMEDLSITVNNASAAVSTEDGPTDEASVTDDQSCSGYKDGDDHDESSEQGEDEEEYELDLGSVNNQQGKSSINPTAVSQCLQRSGLLQHHWPKLGHLSFVSHKPGSNNDLDWALIQFQDPTFYRPNLLVFPENTYEFGVSAGLREGPRRLTRATRSRDVLLLSGMAGLKRGKLATSFGYLMIGPVKQFNEIYNVSMSDGSVLDAGDCGSWVVDSVTHEVYGHVVASDAFGDAYVIPLDNTFRDIKQQLAADQVCLPTESEVLEWIEPRKNPSVLSWCADKTLPDLPRDLRLDFEHEMASSTPESELLDKQLKDTEAWISKSYGSIDDHEAPLCDPFYWYCANYCGDTPASCAMSTSISNSPSVADSRLLKAFPDSGYSSMRSSPLSCSKASSAISSTAAAKGTNSQK